MAGEHGAGARANPYPRKVNDHLNWEAGRQAAMQDFEREFNRKPCIWEHLLWAGLMLVIFSTGIALVLKGLIWLAELIHGKI